MPAATRIELGARSIDDPLMDAHTTLRRPLALMASTLIAFTAFTAAGAQAAEIYRTNIPVQGHEFRFSDSNGNYADMVLGPGDRSPGERIAAVGVAMSFDNSNSYRARLCLHDTRRDWSGLRLRIGYVSMSGATAAGERLANSAGAGTKKCSNVMRSDPVGLREVSFEIVSPIYSGRLVCRFANPYVGLRKQRCAYE